MGVLDVIGGLSKTAGAGFNAFGEEKATRAAQALAQAKAGREAERDRVLNALTQAQTSRLTAPAAPEYKIENGQRIDITAGKATPIEGYVAPATKPEYRVENGQRINVEANTAEPIAGYEAPKPQASYTPVTVGGTDGTPAVVKPFNNKTGEVGEPIGSAKPGVAQRPTEPQMRANLVTPRAEQAAQELMKFYETGAPVKTLAQRIPIAGNFVMNENEQRMVQAAEVVASAILRLESGAAITEGEVRSYAKQLLPQPGDTPEVLQQKKGTLQSTLQAMRAQSTLGATGEAAKTPEQKLWDDAVALYGKDRVLSEFGPRPPE